MAVNQEQPIDIDRLNAMIMFITNPLNMGGHVFERRLEKTCLRGFPLGLTQAGLYNKEDGYRFEILN